MYNFTKMEWWRSPHSSGLLHAFVGFTKDGEKYLTFDVRGIEDGFKPVFSPLCKVGSNQGFKEDSYLKYRQLFTTLQGYGIEEMKKCDYGILYDNKTYTFKK